MQQTDSPPGVGTQLVRLDSLSLDERLAGLQDAIRLAKTPEEAQTMLRLAIDPADAGARVAA